MKNIKTNTYIEKHGPSPESFKKLQSANIQNLQQSINLRESVQSGASRLNYYLSSDSEGSPKRSRSPPSPVKTIVDPRSLKLDLKF